MKLWYLTGTDGAIGSKMRFLALGDLECPQVQVVREKVDFKWLSCRQIVPSQITS